MEKVIQVINDLVRNGIIDKYAIGGATDLIPVYNDLTVEYILRRHGLYERWEKYVRG